MSDTPRTDDLFANPPTNDEAYEFCQKLERELIEARKDTERMDWIDKHAQWTAQLSSSEGDCYRFTVPKDKSPRTGPIFSAKYVCARAAIDAACAPKP